MTRLRHEGGFVTLSLLKTLLVLAVAGVVLFDIAMIATNFVRLDSKAYDIAFEVAGAIPSAQQPDVGALTKQAKGIAKAAGARLVELRWDEEGRIVHVKIERTAGTLVLGNIGPVADWTHATADGQAPATP